MLVQKKVDGQTAAEGSGRREGLGQERLSESPMPADGEPGTGSPSDPFYGLSFKVGVAENKNVTYRDKMEDVHTYIANFAERLDWGYFAIFDGHAGKQVARWCGNNLHTLLEQEILAGETTRDEKDEREKQNDEKDEKDDNINDNDNDKEEQIALPNGRDIKDCLNTVFTKADEMIEREKNGSAGCTAAVAVLGWEVDANFGGGRGGVSGGGGGGGGLKSARYEFIPTAQHKRVLYTSNVGDLRVVLYRGGKCYRLTYDHKATDINEMNRIRDSGGLIMKNRVNGVLAVSRSLGDSYMKDLVIGAPFTTSTEITSEDEFLILACDGLWDVISDEKACGFIAETFKTVDDPQVAAKKLCQLAMDNSTTDNVTVMVVKFDTNIFNEQNSFS